MQQNKETNLTHLSELSALSAGVRVWSGQTKYTVNHANINPSPLTRKAFGLCFIPCASEIYIPHFKPKNKQTKTDVTKRLSLTQPVRERFICWNGEDHSQSEALRRTYIQIKGVLMKPLWATSFHQSQLQAAQLLEELCVVWRVTVTSPHILFIDKTEQQTNQMFKENTCLHESLLFKINQERPCFCRKKKRHSDIMQNYGWAARKEAALSKKAF